jgi:hypothetical protein
LSTRTFTVAGGMGATASSASEGSAWPGGGPATGAGQALLLDCPEELTSTVVQVTIAATASTETIAINGARLRRR